MRNQIDDQVRSVFLVARLKNNKILFLNIKFRCRFSCGEFRFIFRKQPSSVTATKRRNLLCVLSRRIYPSPSAAKGKSSLDDLRCNLTTLKEHARFPQSFSQHSHFFVAMPGHVAADGLNSYTISA